MCVDFEGETIFALWKEPLGENPSGGAGGGCFKTCCETRFLQSARRCVAQNCSEDGRFNKTEDVPHLLQCAEAVDGLLPLELVAQLVKRRARWNARFHFNII